MDAELREGTEREDLGLGWGETLGRAGKEYGGSWDWAPGLWLCKITAALRCP